MVSVANRLDVRLHECLFWRILKMLEGVMGWVVVVVAAVVVLKGSAEVVTGQAQKLRL